MTEENPISDPNLWFYHKGCEGKHFFLGNPHLVPGRLWGWCPKENCSFFLNKNDIEDMPEISAYWLKGFLAGNEPPPPVDEDGQSEFSGPAYEQWQEKIKQFHESGVWQDTK